MKVYVITGIPISWRIFQFLLIHTVKGFGVINKAKVDVLLELSSFFNDSTDVGNLISRSSAFSKSSLDIWKFKVHVLLKPGLENFEENLVCNRTQERESVAPQHWSRLACECPGVPGGGVSRQWPLQGQRHWVRQCVHGTFWRRSPFSSLPPP